MRNTPMNYLMSIAAAGLLWLLTGVLLGNHLAYDVPLTLLTTEQFLSLYQIGLGVAAVLGLAACLAWFYYGSRRSTAGDLPRARRIWDQLFLAEIAFAGLVVAVLGYLFSTEGLRLTDYLLLFGACSLQTYLFFWLGTLALSPRTVINIPRGRR